LAKGKTELLSNCRENSILPLATHTGEYGSALVLRRLADWFTPFAASASPVEGKVAK
jgi:hypothetical protein